MIARTICYVLISCILGLSTFGCQSSPKSSKLEPSDETVDVVSGMELERIDVALQTVAKKSPYGSSSRGGYPHSLSESPPSSVSNPPPGKTVYYGELTFTDSARFLFAISLPATSEAKAQFYLDSNQNGDFTDDNPRSYLGTGSKGTAANLSFQIPRPNGKHELYTIWLWTTLEIGALSFSNMANPGFNYYATCHKAGTLTLDTDQGIQNFHVTAVDSIDYDANYQIDKVIIDWNGNNQREDADVVPVGEERFYQGVLLTLVDIKPYADTIVFSQKRAGSAPRNVLDVEADLALEPIVGNSPPPIGVKDLDGKLVQLEEYSGKVVLIDFWASWCDPCVQEAPNVLETYKRFHDLGFEIIGISLDTDRADLDAFLEGNGVLWRQIYDGKGWKGTIPTRYRVQGIPTPILVGRDGKIVSLQARGSSLPKLVEVELGK